MRLIWIHFHDDKYDSIYFYDKSNMRLIWQHRSGVDYFQ